ncbi:MAG TPA: hypothetical protein VG276_29695 [Actinomycetes bacterium]|jgi:cation:H+ antiporter|nr:hypothetical protein [Actinomycetes bacterium]
MDTPRTPPASSQVHLAEVGVCDACLRSGRQRLNVGLALGAALPGAYLGLALLAGLYAWHLNTTSGLSTLVSSKVNQWTLLVGTLPLVFTVASGTATGLPVGPAQREELLLTAAQSLFAVAVLVNLEISVREAAALSGLFLVQFGLAALVPGSTELLVVALAYLVGAAVLLLRARRLLGPLLRDGLRTPYHRLQDQRRAPQAGGHRPATGGERPGAPP